MSSIRLKKNIVERKKRSLIRIGIIAAILLILCMAAYLSVDRTAPTFDFTEAASVYSVDGGTDLDVSIFLKGVKASDNVDGDLTERIAIKSMRQNADASISVIYCVRDNAGNLTMEERIYNLDVPKDDIASSGDDYVQLPEDASTSGEETEDQSAEENEEESVPRNPDEQTESQPEDTTDVPAEPDIPSEAEPQDIPSDTEPQDIPVEVQPSEPEAVPEDTEQRSETPVIILNAAEAHIAVGSSFNYPGYIAEVWDDVDDQTQLLSNIWIENYELIDWNISGVYELIFHVVDSDGNISDGQPFTLYVEWQ